MSLVSFSPPLLLDHHQLHQEALAFINQRARTRMSDAASMTRWLNNLFNIGPLNNNQNLSNVIKICPIRFKILTNKK